MTVLLWTLGILGAIAAVATIIVVCGSDSWEDRDE